MERTAVIVGRSPPWLMAVERTIAAASVEAVAKTTSFDQATRLIEQLGPDLVVAELEIDEGGTTAGLDWLTQTCKRFPGLKMIVLSDADDPILVEAALSSGASVYVVKKAAPTDLTVAVRQAYQRSLFLNHPISDPPAQMPAPEASGLTKRELEILAMTASGLANSQIAKQLWVTEQTVKFHLSNIYRKLGVTNRTQASRQAQLRGLLPPERTNA